MESTQDIVHTYLGRDLDRNLPPNFHAIAQSNSARDLASDFDLDSLADPLEDFDIPLLLSPPTPFHIPSPKIQEKTLTQQPQNAGGYSKPQSPALDIEFSDWGDLAAAATHWGVDSGAVPTPKEFERYLALLASATDKLVRQLSAERTKARALQAQVAALEAERAAADAIRAEVALLRHRNAELEARAVEGERAARAHSAVVRENALLREKLAKYKALHDAAEKKQALRPKSAPQLGLPPRDAVVDQLVALLRRLEPQSVAPALQYPQTPHIPQMPQLQMAQPLHPSQLFEPPQLFQPPQPVPQPPHAQFAQPQAQHPAPAPTATAPAPLAEDGLLALAGYVARIGSEMHKVNENLEGTCRCRIKAPCSACLSASGGLAGAAHSSPQGHTEALMGKYAWNRTV